MADDDIERLLREVEQATQADSGRSPAKSTPSSVAKPDGKPRPPSSVRGRALASGGVAAVVVFAVFGLLHTLTWWLPIVGPNPFWGAVAGFGSAAGATYVWGRRS